MRSHHYVPALALLILCTPPAEAAPPPPASGNDVQLAAPLLPHSAEERQQHLQRSLGLSAELAAKVDRVLQSARPAQPHCPPPRPPAPALPDAVQHELASLLTPQQLSRLMQQHPPRPPHPAGGECQANPH